MRVSLNTLNTLNTFPLFIYLFILHIFSYMEMSHTPLISNYSILVKAALIRQKEGQIRIICFTYAFIAVTANIIQ